MARRSWRWRPTVARRSSDDTIARRVEPRGGPRRLARSGRADEHDEARIGQPDGHRATLAHPPFMIAPMIFTTRCAGCDRRVRRCAAPCRFALLGPAAAGRRPACSSPRRSPAGSATSSSGSSTATGGRSPVTSPACSSTGSPAPASGSTSSPGRRPSLRRRQQRGFDQAELVARQVARQLGVPCRRLLERAGRRAGADRAGPRGAARRAGVPGPPAGAGGAGPRRRRRGHHRCHPARPPRRRCARPGRRPSSWPRSRRRRRAPPGPAGRLSRPTGTAPGPITVVSPGARRTVR